MEDVVNAIIHEQADGTFAIVNDDTGEGMGENFPTRGKAEQFALDHDCCIVTNYPT
jgi:hypothetical protein